MLPQFYLRQGVSVDRTCGILFANKPDFREARPLYYPCRILQPQSAKDVDTSFARSSLWNNGRTEPVSTLLPSKSMRAVEDLSPTALPTTVDATTSAPGQGAYKSEQLGDEAMEKLLASLLDGTEGGGERWCVQIVDVSPGVGNMFMAFLRRKAAGVAASPGLFYMCVCDTDVHAEWMTKLMQREVLDLCTAKKLTIAGCEATAGDPPANLLEDAPTPPSLTVLAYRPYTADETPLGLQVPPELFLKWSQHPVHGQAMKDLVDSCSSTSRYLRTAEHVRVACPMLPWLVGQCIFGRRALVPASNCW